MEVIQHVRQQTTMVMVLELAVVVEVVAAATTAAAATAMQIRQRVAVARPGLPKMRATK